MAILLFGSWIVVILSIIIQNISLAQRIQDKTVATMLAKEAIEMFYSYKDTNIDKGEYRDSHEGWVFDTTSTYCIQRRSNDWLIEIKKWCSEADQKLIEYINTWTINAEWVMFKHWVVSDSNRKVSRFRRYCEFEEITGTDPVGLKRTTDWWHLALIISCTVVPTTASSNIVNRSVTLSSMIWQNRE